MEPSPDTENPEVAPVPVLETHDTHPEPPKHSWMQNLLRTTALVAGMLLLGMALIYFVLYMPANNALKTSQADLSTAQAKITDTTAKMTQAQADLTEMTKNFQAAQSQLNASTARIALLKLQTDVSLIRVAILQQDRLTALQALDHAQTDLDKLLPNLTGSDTASALKERLNLARTTFQSDPLKALAPLDELFANLLLLGERMD